MFIYYDRVLITSNVEAAKKIQCLFTDFNIHGAMTIKEQYDPKLCKNVVFREYWYLSLDIEHLYSKKDEFLDKLGDIMFTYDL